LRIYQRDFRKFLFGSMAENTRTAASLRRLMRDDD